jgi:spore coat-associated protein N
MSLKKQFAVTLASVGLGAALIGGGTFAYFNDTETSNGNTFAAGTIDLRPDLTGAAVFNITNAKPGQEWDVNYTLKNAGSLPANVSVTADYTANGNGDASDIGTQLVITDLKFGGNPVTVDAGADNVLTLNELDNINVALGALGAVGTADDEKAITFKLTFKEANAPQNEYQGDSATVNLVFEARQQ